MKCGRISGAKYSDCNCIGGITIETGNSIWWQTIKIVIFKQNTHGKSIENSNFIHTVNKCICSQEYYEVLYILSSYEMRTLGQLWGWQVQA